MLSHVAMVTLCFVLSSAYHREETSGGDNGAADGGNGAANIGCEMQTMDDEGKMGGTTTPVAAAQDDGAKIGEDMIPKKSMSDEGTLNKMLNLINASRKITVDIRADIDELDMIMDGRKSDGVGETVGYAVTKRK